MTKSYLTNSIESTSNAEAMRSPSKRSVGFLRQFARACTILPVAQTIFVAN